MHVVPSNKQCSNLSTPTFAFAFSGVFLCLASVTEPSFRVFFGGVATDAVVPLGLFRRCWLGAGASPTSTPGSSSPSLCWLRTAPVSTLPSCCSAMAGGTDPPTRTSCKGSSHPLSLSSACSIACANRSHDMVAGGQGGTGNAISELGCYIN